jgi:NAD-dependent SIR2 family protein deacetylase
MKRTAFLREFILNIEKDLVNNKLALFVGSGISVVAGYPRWKSIILDMSLSLGYQENYKLKEKDYLKIPEDYFLEYGSFAYKTKLKELFSFSNLDLTLHKEIINIGAYHIISTNWDSLFEKALSEEDFYSPVSNDNALSQTTNLNLLINMHGSFKHLDYNDNAIVLKKSDYKNYKNNFPLIENYVKSIFSTKRVVFIGYSLSDTNIKRILKWVKNRTLNHIFPYLILHKKFNKKEFIKYKKKGIHIIYIPEIYEYFGEKYISGNYKKDYQNIIQILNQNQS